MIATRSWLTRWISLGPSVAITSATADRRIGVSLGDCGLSFSPDWVFDDDELPFCACDEPVEAPLLPDVDPVDALLLFFAAA